MEILCLCELVLLLFTIQKVAYKLQISGFINFKPWNSWFQILKLTDRRVLLKLKQIRQAYKYGMFHFFSRPEMKEIWHRDKRENKKGNVIFITELYI